MTTVTVVGAGVVGLATALALRERGLDVSVVEKQKQLPIDKACGEGVMPDAVEILARLGVVPPGRPFVGIRYQDQDSMVDGRFPERAGLGVRRTELSRVLAERCRELGVDIHLDTEVRLVEARCSSGRKIYRLAPEGEKTAAERRVFAPDIVVAADGLRSRLRTCAGLSGPSNGRRFGVRQHFSVAPWSDRVEVYWRRGAEAYVTPVSAHEVGVAFLFRPPLEPGTSEQAPVPRLLERFEDLKARLEGARTTSSARGIGPLHQPARDVAHRNLFLVGDAAGYLDAITGEGMALGFHDAMALADCLGTPDSQEPNLFRAVRSYRRRLKAHRRLPTLTTHLALLLSSHPALRGWLLGSLEREPALFDRLLAVHCRAASPIRSGLPTLLKLVIRVPGESLWSTGRLGRPRVGEESAQREMGRPEEHQRIERHHHRQES